MKRNIARILSVVFLLVLTISYPVRAQASDDESRIVSIIIEKITDFNEEGHRLMSSYLDNDVPAYIVDGTTMVPVRALAEAFDYNVEYQAKDRKVIISEPEGDNELVLTIDSKTVLQNGKEDTMLQAVTLHNDRTFIPLRYVSEYFGKYVTWSIGLDDVMYIWVSSLELLTQEDVAVEEDEDNYEFVPNFAGWSIYELKSGGQTHRGIRIGDSYEKVVERYGEPHDKFLKDGKLNYIRYWAIGSHCVIYFYFQNDIVERVSVSL